MAFLALSSTSSASCTLSLQARATRQSSAKPSSKRSSAVVCAQQRRESSGAAAAAESQTLGASLANAARCFTVSAAAAAVLLTAQPACAELNAREAARGGEFNRGSAQQFGGYDLRNEDVVGVYGKDLRLSNFTGAEMRGANLMGANLTGAYLMKATAFAANFAGANLSDALMDRAVLNNANFTDAILTRVVLTMSDLTGSKIDGADFSDAMLDVKQQQALCKYAAGTNSVTGVSTRKSLNCGGARGALASSPSRYMTDESGVKPEAAFDASRFSAYQ
eukprot:CAMPEP_0197583670 /NCGR_PEP_ID=MMETSP1326-20131121/6510_1 /TAXON_ID=1155430 /ORGANISM="Genus nov. species nov., Strain RCC2288" /LENGTH=277 /DNA_ID=CAMNT_0043147925 /DNA_START=87 /DNA_END=920 /DNA_ORIENTATION=+